jgi:polygalacturonase
MSRLDRQQFLTQLAFGGGALTALAAAPGAAAQAPLPSRHFDVRAFGAAGDGQTLDTVALQRAVDACAAVGGGTVRFPAGTYLSGTVVLKSNVTLRLEAGAVLLGSPDPKDYPPRTPSFRSYTDLNYVEHSLLYAENAERVSIVGPGVIDGQGGARVWQLGHGTPSYRRRPFLIRMIECRQVTLRDVGLRDAAMWVQHYLACDDLLLDGLTVDSTVNANNDGVDVDGCRRVRIVNCRIRSGDDAVVLKSTSPRACEQVVISNCILSSECNAFKCGTESTGGFRDIAVSNCVIHDTRLSGIALEMVDGGTLEGVSVVNVRMVRTANPIFLRLGNRARPYLSSGPGGGSGTHVLKPGMAVPGVGHFRNVQLAHISADGGDILGCALAGLPEHPLEDIRLTGLRLVFAGGGLTADVARPVPELEAAYPEYHMFGRLPAYGFFCRHVRGLVMDGVQLATVAADQRPALVCDQVEDLEVSRWRATGSPDAPEILLRNTRDVWIQGSRPAVSSAAFVRVEGEASREIVIPVTPRRREQPLIESASDVPAAAEPRSGPMRP